MRKEGFVNGANVAIKSWPALCESFVGLFEYEGERKKTWGYTTQKTIIPSEIRSYCRGHVLSNLVVVFATTFNADTNGLLDTFE